LPAARLNLPKNGKLARRLKHAIFLRQIQAKNYMSAHKIGNLSVEKQSACFLRNYMLFYL